MTRAGTARARRQDPRGPNQRLRWKARRARAPRPRPRPPRPPVTSASRAAATKPATHRRSAPSAPSGIPTSSVTRSIAPTRSTTGSAAASSSTRTDVCARGVMRPRTARPTRSASSSSTAIQRPTAAENSRAARCWTASVIATPSAAARIRRHLPSSSAGTAFPQRSSPVEPSARVGRKSLSAVGRATIYTQVHTAVRPGPQPDLPLAALAEPRSTATSQARTTARSSTTPTPPTRSTSATATLREPPSREAAVGSRARRAGASTRESTRARCPSTAPCAAVTNRSQSRRARPGRAERQAGSAPARGAMTRDGVAARRRSGRARPGGRVGPATHRPAPRQDFAQVECRARRPR
jgi:hypothetical protein